LYVRTLVHTVNHRAEPVATTSTNDDSPLGDAPAALSERYTPFVLCNRTGLQVKFWTHSTRVARLAHIKGSDRGGTTVDGGADFPFAIERAAGHVSAYVITYVICHKCK
jgi:hypothetical protein